ncbi:baculoviral IAP repeat-containing protein 7 [Biomphalaria glabrata]|nr:baculoviral IAP repeat-containing protein 7 [Biomphalaria glabrata]
MNRVASFRQAPENYHPRFSFVRLSEAGFSYTGESSFVQCQGCGKKVSMDDMVNDGEIISPNDVKFHNSICEFVDKVSAEMENCRGEMMFFPNHTCLQLNVCRGFSHSNGKHHREQQSVTQTSSSSSKTCIYDESQDVDYEIQIKNPQSTQNDMKCSKNPGHFGYFPVSNFKMDHLPGLSRNPYVLKILQLLALMTVKINVKMCNTSGCYHQSGTGFVLLETRESPSNKNVALSACNGTNISCGMCRDNSTSDTDNEVYIITSRRLVTCSPDPGNITVDFCCDELLSGQSTTIEVASILPINNIESILVCRPKDVAFVQKIHHIRSQILELVGNIPDSVKDFLSKKVFLIHHPHGKDKVLSHGDFVQVNYTLIADDKTGTVALHKISRSEPVIADVAGAVKMLMYTADTCHGSTGAPVITFTQRSPRGHFDLDIWMHVGQHKTHGLGCSAMKALEKVDLVTLKNFASQGTAKNDTNETATYKEDAKDSLCKSPLSSQPSYPAFGIYEKRLESFSNWSHQHIHQPEYLARIGFFYAGYSDCVRCFQCGLGLRSWKPGDNVLEEHKRLRGTCPFLQKLLDNVTR